MTSISKDWHEVHIVDKTGKRSFPNTCSPMSLGGVLKELKWRLSDMKKHPGFYSFLDIKTAKIILDGCELNSKITQEDLDMLEALKG